MKSKNDFQTSAINKAARGVLINQDARESELGRARMMYGFKDQALHLSGEELKIAWVNAASSIKKSRG